MLIAEEVAPETPAFKAANQVKFTSQDILLLAEENNKRYEVIEGELSVSRMPGFEHQYSLDCSYYSLKHWSDLSRLGVAMTTPGVVFSDDDDVVPDVVWISYERLAARALDEAGHFCVCPELVIEVLSPGSRNERRDRETKLNLYSRRGAAEYWIIDWMRREVTVFRRADAALHLAATLRADEELTTPLLPGFACCVADLFFLPPANLERR
jgi:Uma2 family endonuclease